MPVWHHDQQPPVILQDPPGFTQQTAGIFRMFQAMHQQDPVEGKIR